MKPKVYYDFNMNPKCRFCNGEQEDVGFRGSGIPFLSCKYFKCNKCLIRQTYGRSVNELLECTYLFPTDRTVDFDYGQFHYVIEFNPQTLNLTLRSYSEIEGWKDHFDITVLKQPDWLTPNLSIEKIKTLLLFS